MNATSLVAFATCAPGLEPLLEQELRHLDAREVRRLGGGVEFAAEVPDLYRANLHLRTASRVLARLGRFHAEEFWELEKRAAKLAWEHYLAPGQPVAVRATCHKSRLYHSDAVAERVARAIGTRLGQTAPLQPATEEEDIADAQLVIARLDHDECSLSVDSSGALLHKRGYRLETAKAPLRETLAAAMLMAAGWEAAIRRSTDPEDARAIPLLDPFCGSGTLAIEGALLALNLPPGRGRRFAFMHWPGYQAAAWDAVTRAAVPTWPASPLLIMGSDRDEGAVEAARANARRAGVAEHVTLQCRPFSAIEPPADPGWVVSNPPYGLRTAPPGRRREAGVGGRPPLRGLYAALGDVLRERCPDWNVALLCPDELLIRATGLSYDPARSLHTLNGGLRVTLWQGKVPPPHLRKGQGR